MKKWKRLPVSLLSISCIVLCVWNVLFITWHCSIIVILIICLSIIIFFLKEVTMHINMIIKVYHVNMPGLALHAHFVENQKVLSCWSWLWKKCILLRLCFYCQCSSFIVWTTCVCLYLCLFWTQVLFNLFLCNIYVHMWYIFSVDCIFNSLSFLILTTHFWFCCLSLCILFVSSPDFSGESP